MVVGRLYDNTQFEKTQLSSRNHGQTGTDGWTFECNIKCRYCDAWFEKADDFARHCIQFHKNVKELFSSSHQRKESPYNSGDSSEGQYTHARVPRCNQSQRPPHRKPNTWRRPKVHMDEYPVYTVPTTPTTPATPITPTPATPITPTPATPITPITPTPATPITPITPTPETVITKRRENTQRKPPRIWKGCIAALAILCVIVVCVGCPLVVFHFQCELLKISCHKDKPSESLCNTTQSAEYGTTSEFVCVVPLEGPTAIALRQTSPRPDVPDVLVAKPIDGTKAQVIRIRDNVEVNVAITAKEVEFTVHLVDTTCLQTGNFTVTLSNQTHAVTSVVNINLDEMGQFYCPCTVPGDIGDNKNVQCKLDGDLDTNIGLKRKTEKSEKEELLALFTIDQILNNDGTIAVDSMNTLFLDMARIGDSYSFSLRFLSIQCSVEGLYVIVVDSKRFETYVNVKGEGETMVPTIHTYSLTDNRQGIIADFNMVPYKATVQCTANTMCASGELKLYQYDTATKEYESIESPSITQRTTYNGDLRTVVLTQTLTKTDVEAILEKDKYIITCKFTDSMGIEYMSEEFQVRVIRGDWCASSSVPPGCNTFHPYDCTKFIQCTDDSLHATDCVAGSGVTYWTNNINNQCYGACTKAPPADKSRCGS